MGVASPFQSSKPLEYWLDGLMAAELVQLWEFLSRNLDDFAHDASGCQATLDFKSWVEDLPSSAEVKKHVYSESLPSSFLCLKTPRARTRSQPPKGAIWSRRL